MATDDPYRIEYRGSPAKSLAGILKAGMVLAAISLPFEIADRCTPETITDRIEAVQDSIRLTEAIIGQAEQRILEEEKFMEQQQSEYNRLQTRQESLEDSVMAIRVSQVEEVRRLCEVYDAPITEIDEQIQVMREHYFALNDTIYKEDGYIFWDNPWRTPMPGKGRTAELHNRALTLRENIQGAEEKLDSLLHTNPEFTKLRKPGTVIKTLCEAIR